MAESFCRMEMTEAVLDCCEMAFAIDSDEQGAVFGDGNEPTSSANCGTPPDRQPPAVCTVGCAERWNPLVEDCAQYLTELQPLTEACEARAQQFLGEAPSTVTVTGLAFHHDDNGNYSIAPRTIGGKPYWTKADPTAFLYAVNEPHQGYAIGATLGSCECPTSCLFSQFAVLPLKPCVSLRGRDDRAFFALG